MVELALILQNIFPGKLSESARLPPSEIGICSCYYANISCYANRYSRAELVAGATCSSDSSLAGSAMYACLDHLLWGRWSCRTCWRVPKLRLHATATSGPPAIPPPLGPCCRVGHCLPPTSCSLLVCTRHNTPNASSTLARPTAPSAHASGGGPQHSDVWNALLI